MYVSVELRCIYTDLYFGLASIGTQCMYILVECVFLLAGSSSYICECVHCRIRSSAYYITALDV